MTPQEEHFRACAENGVSVTGSTGEKACAEAAAALAEIRDYLESIDKDALFGLIETIRNAWNAPTGETSDWLDAQKRNQSALN